MYNTERLLLLADFLETIPPKSFDIVAWVASEATKPEGDTPGKCGFAGCAVGWAAHAKLFEGFEMGVRDNGFGARHSPTYRGSYDWEAVAALFDMPYNGMESKEALFLFYEDSYEEGMNVTPERVAKRIRAFVADPTICAVAYAFG